MNGFDLDMCVDWLGTFALHSTCALGAALLVSLALRARWTAAQERLLRFALWAPLVSSTVQLLVLDGPWGGGFSRPAPPAEVLLLSSLPGPARADDVPLRLVAAPTAPWTPTSWIALAAASTAAIGLLWLWRSHRRLGHLLAQRRPELGERVLAAAATVAVRLDMRRLPRLSRCDAMPTPIAFGLLRPEICLPSRAGELGAASLQAMLAHELAHLRRRDPAVMALGTLLQALFPWQVLLPFVRRRWLKLVELRCDAIAAGHTSPTAVARCLLEVAEWLRPPHVAVPALAMAARASSLRDRVEAALQYRTARPPRRLLSLAFGGVSLSALTVAAPGLQPAPAAFSQPAFAMALDDITPASSLQLVLEEHAALAADADRLRRELAGRDLSPQLEQLLATLQRRLLVLERIAARIELRAARRTDAR